MQLLEKDDFHLLSSTAVFHAEQVVLVANEKRETVSLPAGHHTKGEAAIDAARRELAEEAGVYLDESQMVFVTRLRRSASKMDSIFAAQLAEPVELQPGSDADRAVWQNLSDLPPLNFRHDVAIQLAMKALQIPPEQRGLLVVIEGIDGSGKSTQISKLLGYLHQNGYAFTATSWSSSKLLGRTIKRSKKKRRLTPVLYFLLHAADMLDRHDAVIVPAMRRNEVVVCDRYVYTGLVRDTLRGIDQEYNRSLYQKILEPDVVFHCKVEPNVAVARLASGKGLSYYGSGLDIGLGHNKESSALAYATKMDELYAQVLPEDTITLDASGDEDEVFTQILAALQPMLKAKFGGGDLAEAREIVEQLLQG